MSIKNTLVLIGYTFPLNKVHTIVVFWSIDRSEHCFRIRMRVLTNLLQHHESYT